MNTSFNFRVAAAVLAAVGGFSLASSSVFAQEDGSDYSFKLFLSRAYVTPTNDTPVTGGTVEATNENGDEFGFEWMPADRFGLELAYLDTEFDIERNGVNQGDVNFEPVMLTFNFHLLDRNGFDWYIGPTIAHVNWGDFHRTSGPARNTDNIDEETTFGVSTGVTIGLGQMFAIQAGVRYLEASANSGAGKINVDPLYATLGIALRF